MSQRQIRRGAWGITVIIMLAVVVFVWRGQGPGMAGKEGPKKDIKPRPAGQPVSMKMEGTNILISLGNKNPKKEIDWKGEVKVSEGKILKLQLLQGKGKVEGNQFTASTLIAPKKKNYAQVRLRVKLDAPPTAKLTVKLEDAQAEVVLSALNLGEEKKFPKKKVAFVREDSAIKLTDPVTEDDYPAMARASDGKLWLVYSEFQRGKPLVTQRVLAGNFDELVPNDHGDQVRMKYFDGTAWSPCIDVTAPGLDIWRPTVTVDKAGVVHVAWSEQINGNFDIYHRAYTPGKNGGKGSWSEITRISEAPGTDYHVVAATNAEGIPCLAWQGFRGGFFQILATKMAKGSWEKPQQITTAKANHWCPSIAADSKGQVYVAYDTYEKGNYDVRLCQLGPQKKTVDVASSLRFEARPHIAVDSQDRVWIAYEEGDEQWGKDFSTAMFKKIGFEKNPGFALYINRTVRVKCLGKGQLSEPVQSIKEACDGKLDRNKSVPRIAFDKSGGLWLTFRHHPKPLGAGEMWNSYVLRYEGDKWSSPRQLPNSENLLDNRPALVSHGQGIMMVFSGDHRKTHTNNRGINDLYASLLLPVNDKKVEVVLQAAKEPEPQNIPVVHPNETADVAAIRTYVLEHKGKKLKFLRGEFHRHTEYTAHRDGDGLIEDAWRYGLDAAQMDWIGNGDHDNGSHDIYCWWQIQKFTDLFNNNPHFVSVQTYERSNKYPNGHRNVIMPKRGIRPLMRGVLEGTEDKGTPDTKILYKYLKHFGGICASHTSGTGMGTDWRDNDPEVEPIVEIYQGHRHNYEHFGAPRSATKDTQIGGYEPKGFVWNAFEKGIKFGFQASSDHISTHMSYAIVITDDATRQGLIDAFKKRHCYAATDNIILDVRSGDHIQGDIFETKKMPSLDIIVKGTAPVAKISVIRNNKYVYTASPNKKDVKLTYTDMEPVNGKSSYYYVRIEQADGNLAWGSPMWITYKGK